MMDHEVADLVREHGVGGKLVTAVCRRMGWPRRSRVPDEWYAAFRSALGDQIERAIKEG